jgi:hypothetical protein
MASYLDPLKNPVTVPASRELFWVLLLGAVIAFLLGVLFSGVRWWRLPINPWLWFRAAIHEASLRGESYFWFIWTLFAFAIIFAFASLIVGGVLLYGY